MRILTLQIVRSSEHGGDRTLIRFLEPPVLRGTAFLTIDESPRNTVTYAFLPELKLVRRIAGTERSGPFFGTDLSIEDMEAKSSTDFRARVTEKRDGCVLIAFEPRSRDVSGYDEMMGCVEENQGVFRWIEFLVGGEVRKRLVVDADQVQVIDGRKIPFVMTIRDLQRRTETTIRTIRYEMPESVPEQVFSVENLRRGTSDRDRASALGKR